MKDKSMLVVDELARLGAEIQEMRKKRKPEPTQADGDEALRRAYNRLTQVAKKAEQPTEPEPTPEIKALADGATSEENECSSGH